MKMLISLALSALGNAIGLLAASLVFEDFKINLAGYVMSVLFFTGASAILSPFMLKLAIKYLPALRGGIALVTVLVVLIITSMLTNGIEIGSLSTWMMSPLVIWLSTVAAGILLPMMIFKEAVSNSETINSLKP